MRKTRARVKNATRQARSSLDARVIGNLMNFPKHVFGFPFGSYATDGNESLSLIVYAYRLLRPRARPTALVVDDCAEDTFRCCRRVGVKPVVVAACDLERFETSDVVAVLTTFDSPHLERVAAFARKRGVPAHARVSDATDGVSSETRTSL